MVEDRLADVGDPPPQRPPAGRSMARAGRFGGIGPLVRTRPTIILVALWVVAATPWLTWRNTIPYDAKDEFYPGVIFSVRSLLRGEAPLWNPYLFSGYPSFADPQAMTFSPSVVLPMLVAQDFVWFDIVILLHLLFGGIGMLRLGRSYAWTSSAALVAAMVYMFGGVASSRLQHTPMIVTWSFLPWVLVSMRELFRRSSWRATLALGLALGFSALQLTQVTYLSLLVAGSYAIFRLCGIARAENWRHTSAIAVRLGVGGVVSLVVAAPQLVPTLSILPYSNRANIDWAVATANSLSPLAYATLLAPDALGSLWGRYIGPNDVTETYLYLGAFPAAVLLSGLLGRRQGLARGETLFWTLAIALSVVYTLGSATPAFRWMYEYLPGVGRFRRPGDAAFLFVFCAAILIGASMNPRPAGGEATARQSLRLHVTGAVVGLLCVAALSIGPWFGTEASPVSLAMLLVGFLGFMQARSTARPNPWLVVLVLSVFVDLRFHNLGNRLNAHRADEYRMRTSLEHNATMRFLAQRSREHLYDRIELRTGAAEANVPALIGIASIGGLNPLVLRDYVHFTGMDSNPATPRRTSGAFDTYQGKVNDLLGVRYLAADGVTREQIARDLGPSYGIVAESDGRVIWENERALPRVLRPRQAIPAPRLSTYTPAMLNAVDLEEYAYIDAPLAMLTKCGGRRAARADIMRYSNNEVVIDVDTNDGAWIVLNDVFHDWWQAELPEGPIPIYRANGIFRAVCIPPGHHAVRFRFEPYRHFLRKLATTLGST